MGTDEYQEVRKGGGVTVRVWSQCREVCQGEALGGEGVGEER